MRDNSYGRTIEAVPARRRVAASSGFTASARPAAMEPPSLYLTN